MKGTIHLAALRNAVDAAAQMPRRSREMPDKPHLRWENSSTLPPVRGSFTLRDERLVKVGSQIQQRSGQPRLLSNACPACDIILLRRLIGRITRIYGIGGIFFSTVLCEMLFHQYRIKSNMLQICCKKCKCD